MIYILHDRSSSAGIPRTVAEAMELLEEPWPINPYHLAAAVDCHLIQSAYALTQASESPRPKLIAHDLTRSTWVGDVVIDIDGHAFLLGEGDSDDDLRYNRLPLRLDISLPAGYYNERSKSDLSRYRITYRRTLP